MKVFPILLLAAMLMAFASDKKLLTAKYGGSYSYGISAKIGRVGYIDIYPETDSTILFYLECNRGPNDYNSGSMYGRLFIIADSGVYFSSDRDSCMLSFSFSKKYLKIRSLNKSNCDFGYGVYADGTFNKNTDKIKKYFIDITGDTTYFGSLWNK